MNLPHAIAAERWALPSVVLVMGLLPLVMLQAGCSDTPQSGLPTVKMQIGGRTFTLEIASDEDSRSTGLMRRDSMPSNHGMIFVFPEEEGLKFWMKNTRIPLDILYLDAAGRVVSIHQMKPYDLRTTPSAGPAKYAIELNEGAAAGVKAGDQLAIPAEAKDTKE